MASPTITDWLTPRVDAFFGLFDEPAPLEPPEIDNDGRAVIDMRGVIGYTVDADELAPILRNLDATTLEIHLDSGGGNVWHGVAIANALRQHPAQVEIHVDAMAASAASVIAMAGDTVTMHPGSMMMVHNARGFADGATAEDLRALAEVMDKINVSMSEIYAARAGGTNAEWLDTMAAETWFTGTEAIAAGLADTEITADDTPNVDAQIDLTEVFGYRYNGRPDAPDPVLAGAESAPNGAGKLTPQRVWDASGTITDVPAPVLNDHELELDTAPDIDWSALTLTGQPSPKFDPEAFAAAVVANRKAS